jgi:7-cyano-7-deazaguanine reductase
MSAAGPPDDGKGTGRLRAAGRRPVGTRPPAGGGGAERRFGEEHASGADVGPEELRDAPLGHPTGYPDAYAPALLYALPRAPQREALGIAGALPFQGVDLWTAYELTWLDRRGKPMVAMATFDIPAQSPCIVESKSMKLYLGSFAQTRFDEPGEVTVALTHDLSKAVGATVRVVLDRPERFAGVRLHELEGTSLDALDAECTAYDVDATLLAARGDKVAETLTTNLFRSVCPVTGQPDIASVAIGYEGPQIDRAALLRYLVSYRCHAGFHEHCVERIFVDVLTQCRTQWLSVYARFLRRGGIDINPFRSNVGTRPPVGVRTARQ